MTGNLLIAGLAVLLLIGVSAAGSYGIVSVSPDEISANSQISFVIEVENEGAESARNIRAYLASGAGGISVTGGAELRSNLDSGKTAEFAFPVQIGSVGKGKYELTLTIIDEDGTAFLYPKLDVTREGRTVVDYGGPGTGSGPGDGGLNDKEGCDADLVLNAVNLVNERDGEINPSDDVEIAVYLRSRTEHTMTGVKGTLREDYWNLKADGTWYSYREIGRGSTVPGYFMIKTFDMEPGEYEMGIDVEYGKKGHKCEDVLSFEFEVAGDYGVSVDLKPDQSSVEPMTEVGLEFMVRNRGSREDTFTIGFNDGVSDWVHEYPKEVTLGRGEEKVLPVLIYVPDVDGTYRLGARARSKTLGTAEDSDSIQLSVERPLEPVHALEVGAPRQATDVAPDRAREIKVEVENTGNVREDVRVGVEGPEWVYVTPVSFGLAAGEKREILVYLAPPKDAEMGTYDVRVGVRGIGSDVRLEKTLGVYVTGPAGRESANREAVAAQGPSMVTGMIGAVEGSTPAKAVIGIAIIALIGALVYWKIESEEEVI